MANRSYRIVGLDLLRIGLASLIFLFHSHIHILHCSYGIFNGFVNMGAIAMTGFFLLSGCAINFSTESKNMADINEIKRFYIKRIISIVPLYYTYALINVTINIVTNGNSKAFEELILFPIEVTGIQSVFATLFPYSHNGGSWFISCILICYLTFPLLNILTKNLNDKGRIITIMALCAILLYSPIVQNYLHLQSLYSNPFFRLLEFAIGLMVCQINKNIKTDNKVVDILRKPTTCIITIIALIGGINFANMINIPRDYMLYSWVALPCFISLLVSLGHLKFNRLQNSKTIQYLSTITYSFFLSQIILLWNIVKYVMTYFGCESNLIKILLSATMCFCIANVLHFCIEKPTTNYLKAKWLK